jgi:hypothetical protein
VSSRKISVDHYGIRKIGGDYLLNFAPKLKAAPSHAADSESERARAQAAKHNDERALSSLHADLTSKQTASGANGLRVRARAGASAPREHPHGARDRARLPG